MQGSSVFFSGILDQFGPEEFWEQSNLQHRSIDDLSIDVLRREFDAAAEIVQKSLRPDPSIGTGMISLGSGYEPNRLFEDNLQIIDDVRVGNRGILSRDSSHEPNCLQHPSDDNSLEMVDDVRVGNGFSGWFGIDEISEFLLADLPLSSQELTSDMGTMPFTKGLVLGSEGASTSTCGDRLGTTDSFDLDKSRGRCDHLITSGGETLSPGRNSRCPKVHTEQWNYAPPDPLSLPQHCSSSPKSAHICNSSKPADSTKSNALPFERSLGQCGFLTRNEAHVSSTEVDDVRAPQLQSLQSNSAPFQTLATWPSFRPNFQSTVICNSSSSPVRTATDAAHLRLVNLTGQQQLTTTLPTSHKPCAGRPQTDLHEARILEFADAFQPCNGVNDSSKDLSTTSETRTLQKWPLTSPGSRMLSQGGSNTVANTTAIPRIEVKTNLSLRKMRQKRDGANSAADKIKSASVVFKEDWSPRNMEQEHQEESNTAADQIGSRTIEVKPSSSLRKVKHKRQPVSTMECNKRLAINDILVPDQMERAEKERGRRNTMSSKIAALEVLLPSRFRRDRVSIVEDTVKYVRTLQEEVAVLEDKFRKAKLGAGLSTHPVGMESKAEKFGNDPDCTKPGKKGMGTDIKPTSNANCLHPGTKGESSKPELLKVSSTKRREGHVPGNQDKENVYVQFYLQLDSGRERPVEAIKCLCRRRTYFSKTMKALEELELDVCTCNVTKMHDYFVCILLIKARSSSSRTTAVTASEVATRLQSAVSIQFDDLD